MNIIPLPDTKKAVKEFVLFSRTVYKSYPHWVPPIFSDQIQFIHSGHFNNAGEKQLFMAYDKKRPVARLSVHRSFTHNDRYHTNQGFFGFFESIDDLEAARAIFEAGENWLKEKGCNEVVGPMNFSIYDEIGLLLNDFDRYPAVGCPYNPPYYEKLLVELGFRKEIDWYAFLMDRKFNPSQIMLQMYEEVISQSNVQIQPVNLKEWKEETATIFSIFNKAWSNNRGHVDISEKQSLEITKPLKAFVKEELAYYLTVDGVPIAVSITVPDINEALKSTNGSLFPMGFIKFMLCIPKITKLRTVIMGILPEFRQRGYEMALMVHLYKTAIRMGYKMCDMSQIVETNSLVIQALESAGASRYKTYRIYRKALL